MHCTLALVLSLACLLATTRPYALDGLWKLRTSEIPTLALTHPDIVFQFHRNANAQTTITSTLTVTACKELTYEYGVEDDQIALKFIGTSTSLRNCLTDQLTFLRNTLDTVFYFYILDRVLLLLSPLGTAIKLDRVIDLSRPYLNGQFAITSAFTFDPIQDPTVVGNGTHLALCHGSTLFSYRMLSTQNVSVTKLSGPSCKGLVTDLLGGVVLVRVKGSGSGRVVRLYDQKVNLILEMRQQKQFPFTGKISFDNVSAVSPAAATFANPWDLKDISYVGSNVFVVKEVRQMSAQGAAPSVSSTTNNVSNVVMQSGTAPSTANQQATTANAPPATKSTAKPTNSSSIPVNSSTITNPPANASAKTANTSTTTTNPSVNPANASTTNTAAKSTNGTTTIKTTINNTTTNQQQASSSTSMSFVPVASPTDIYGFWYPPSTTPAQLIINPARLFLTATCTAFSSYTFSASSFSNLSVVTGDPQCDQALRSIIFNSNNLYYFSPVPKTLQIRDKSGKVLLQLNSSPK